MEAANNAGPLLQWNLRIVDTLGTQHFVLCREVVLFQVRVYILEYFKVCPLFGGLSSFGVSFIGGFTVYSLLALRRDIVPMSEVCILQDMVFENPTRTITDAEADGWSLRYYDTQIHKAAFVLPRFAKQVKPRSLDL